MGFIFVPPARCIVLRCGKIARRSERNFGMRIFNDNGRSGYQVTDPSKEPTRVVHQDVPYGTALLKRRFVVPYGPDVQNVLAQPRYKDLRIEEDYISTAQKRDEARMERERRAAEENKREAPSFANRIQEQWVKYGTNIVIRLQIHGEPKPRITWFHNADRMCNSSRHFMAHDKGKNIVTLRIYNVQDVDAGWYTCRAENAYGTAETAGMMYVNDPRKPMWQGKRSLIDTKWFHTVMSHSRRVRRYDPTRYTEILLDFYRVR